MNAGAEAPNEVVADTATSDSSQSTTLAVSRASIVRTGHRTRALHSVASASSAGCPGASARRSRSWPAACAALRSRIQSTTSLIRMTVRECANRSSWPLIEPVGRALPVELAPLPGADPRLMVKLFTVILCVHYRRPRLNIRLIWETGTPPALDCWWTAAGSRRKVVSEVDLECSGMRGSDLSVLNHSRTRAWRAALSLNPPSRAGKRAG